MHNGYQNGLRCHGSAQVFQANASAGIHRQIRDTVSLTLQVTHGLQDCRMLDLCCDQMVAPAAIRHGAADQCHIIGLCTAGGEQQLSLLHLQDPCQSLLGIAEVLLRLHSLHMQAGGISVIFTHDLCHQFGYFRKSSGRSGIVQIDFHSLLLLAIYLFSSYSGSICKPSVSKLFCLL